MEFFGTGTRNLLNAAESAIPFSIVRATQFYEFVGRIADSATDGDTVRVSSAPGQPMAADDVATAVARTAAATVFPTRFTDWLVDNAPAPVR
ncbi:MAG: hypothetical protein QOI01_5104 [Mycobacterium sp.]|nr:hypothetical protein [Mycobacterium sp.]